MIQKQYRDDDSVYAWHCSECNKRWYFGENNFHWIGGKDFLMLGRYLGKPPVRNKILVALSKHEDAALDHILIKRFTTEDELERIKYNMLWKEEFDRLVRKYNLKGDVGYCGGCFIRSEKQ